MEKTVDFSIVRVRVDNFDTSITTTVHGPKCDQMLELKVANFFSKTAHKGVIESSFFLLKSDVFQNSSSSHKNIWAIPLLFMSIYLPRLQCLVCFVE